LERAPPSQPPPVGAPVSGNDGMTVLGAWLPSAISRVGVAGSPEPENSIASTTTTVTKYHLV
jgi:hypothetical protein